MKPEAFEVRVPDDALADLKARLAGTRWPGDLGNSTWHYGVEENWLRDMAAYWRDDFDWRAVEARINRFPQFKVTVDGVPIHFIHIRSPNPDAMPLILSHGWPWTFWDWEGVIDRLTTADGPAFHLIVPSLPGFAFSTPLTTTGIGVREVACLWRKLMVEVLGYGRFAAAGGDWGSLISAELGHAFPEDVIGIHLTLPLMPGIDLKSLATAPFAPDEEWMRARTIEASKLIGSHMAVHCADPQTLAYGLADSPIGLAAWLWERRLAWSDAGGGGGGRDRDFLCTIASLYWLTNSIGSSMRIYIEHFRGPWTSLHDRERLIDVPTAYSIAPKELALFPRAMAERLCNLRRWTVLERGGHFHAAEVPELVAEEYRAFFGRDVLAAGAA